MPDMGKGQGKGKGKGKGKEDNCASPPGVYSLAVGDMLVLCYRYCRCCCSGVSSSGNTGVMPAAKE
jgi:hypothetical protein